LIIREYNKWTSLQHHFSFSLYLCFLIHFLPIFILSVRKLSHISELWAEQLLFDVQEFRGFLENLPRKKEKQPTPPLSPEEKSSSESKSFSSTITQVADAPNLSEVKESDQTNPPAKENTDIENKDSARKKKDDEHMEPYLRLIHFHFSPLEKVLKIMTSPAPKFLYTFRSVYPRASSSFAISLMDWRGISSRDQEKLVKEFNIRAAEKGNLKRIEFIQKDFLTNLFGDIKKSINTNL
jgi:hypothetical protein